MAVKNEIPFDDFLNEVDPRYQEFVRELHEHLFGSGCKMKIELKSSGHLVSYTHTPSKKVILNFVFRKKGLITRIYGDNVSHYPALMESLPSGMIQSIAKSPVCKRLLNPDDCNPRCSMGYDFEIHGERYQKCRYNCFMLDVNEENNPWIRSMIKHEIKERTAA